MRPVSLMYDADKWGISYIMWSCNSCNTMFAGKREDHKCLRGPLSGKKPIEENV